MVWPTLGSRTAKEQEQEQIGDLPLRWSKIDSGRSACPMPGIYVSSLSHAHWYQWKMLVVCLSPKKTRVIPNQDLPVAPLQHDPHQFR